MAERPLTDWDSGLCECFEDPNTCCYGFWCGPCLAGTVSRRFGENHCLPLCDICGIFLSTYFCSPMFVPPAALSLRVAMRTKYGIKGSMCKDIAISYCCGICSWCQMHRELKHWKKNPVVINMLSQSVVNMQPAAVMMTMPVDPLPVGAVGPSGPGLPGQTGAIEHSHLSSNVE
ncbi:placenta-specific gene 8 protein [Austrofundulus limnaeus]|uniref:Placenta-specific gene 8 protein n=1 Tax=Austrofundulus limnaeus TaxID=52670 RepID=A0A2I4BPP7_AUSLI|nr:PREDICTED: placenta-specific gene 8 protein-like [Austrofundulus limnaeus]